MAKAKSRERLQRYQSQVQRLYLQDERLRSLKRAEAGPDPLEGYPEGMGSRRRRQARQIEALEAEIAKLQAEEAAEYQAIMDALERLEGAEKRQAMARRYIDGESWEAITEAIYGDKADYLKSREKYLKRVFRLHGRALQELDMIWENEAGGPQNKTGGPGLK